MTSCPKCHHESGDSWWQCGGRCPMPMSPHYDPTMRDTDDLVDPTGLGLQPFSVLATHELAWYDPQTGLMLHGRTVRTMPKTAKRAVEGLRAFRALN